MIFEGKLKDAILLYLGQTHDKESDEIKARELAKLERYNEAFKNLKVKNLDMKEQY